MKRPAILFALILALAIPLMAQGSKEKSKEEMRRELHEFKMKFLAQEVDLKEDQQKAFVDTYEEMSAERHKVRRTVRSLEKRMKEEKNLSDADYTALNRALNSAKQQEAEVERKYDERFSKFMTQKQIFKLKQAQEEWRAKMREMRGKRKASKR